ncbi:LysR family transcriptional regulator [Kocuria sp. TGY1127_2]|uniref:LysR family transcriptional regulator n=1 Tax=Kocuria sp. TGY1127_2 TaxID=2711328 RepID=UPI0015B954F0|nr:LysR family transcriptional regulator [Kocuria sp. TGY1127_2]
MDLELRHLRALEAVGRKKSFTAAARSLHITQPALSRTIQQLEARLGGVTLLNRSSRSVDLTPQGQRLFERARTILREIEDAIAETHQVEELRIGFPWALPDPWISRTLATFERSSGIRTHLTRHDDVCSALLNRAVDVALTRQTLMGTEVETIELFREPRVAAVSTGSRLARRTSIPWKELGQHPVVINTLSGNTRPSLWDPGQRPSSIIECANYDEWITLVAAGKGVGATPASAAASYGHSRVAFVPLDEAPSVPLCLAWRTSSNSRAIQEFRNAALSTLPCRTEGRN